MSNLSTRYWELAEIANAADEAWSEAVISAFPKRHACDVRYTAAARGEPGSELRELWEAKRAADEAQHAEFKACGC